MARRSRTDLLRLGLVAGIAAGQLLFKLCAESLRVEGPWATRTVVPFAAAMAIYGTTTLAWIWVLQRAELGKIYPLMALAFVFVPLALAPAALSSAVCVGLSRASKALRLTITMFLGSQACTS